MPLLEVQNLRTYFETRRGTVKAVDGVSFSLDHGETLGLVGESGSGKTATLLSILRLVPEPAGRILQGSKIKFKGEDLLEKSEDEMCLVRGRHIAIIFQDPNVSLNPVLTVGEQLMDPLRMHQGLRGGSLLHRAKEMLELVRIPEPLRRLKNYPHEMSGGMRQRVVGAIAASCVPDLLLADEPTTSLDVITRAQYLRLLRDIQSKTGMAILFVTHDLGIIARMCHRAHVMYAGRIVERTTVERMFAQPAHPYTEALINSTTRLDRDIDWLRSIEGQPPELHSLPPGCPFAPRCRYVLDKCRQEFPPAFPSGPVTSAHCWRLAP